MFEKVEEIESHVTDFCIMNKIAKDHEYSLLNHVLLIVETEKIAYASNKIMDSIDNYFNLHSLLK
jgi:hypothetical protein